MPDLSAPERTLEVTDPHRLRALTHPLRLQLLSPASRVVATTADLAGFWVTGYPAVRSELRGRYPRHPWPEDPAVASATKRARPRS